MAVTNPTFSPKDDGSLQTITWVLTGTNTGAPIPYAEWADKSVQVGAVGDTFGAGVVGFEGSNDGQTWNTLRAPDSTALSFTANGLKQVLEMTAFVRPNASVSVTQVTVVLTVRRNNSMRT